MGRRSPSGSKDKKFGFDKDKKSDYNFKKMQRRQDDSRREREEFLTPNQVLEKRFGSANLAKLTQETTLELAKLVATKVDKAPKKAVTVIEPPSRGFARALAIQNPQVIESELDDDGLDPWQREALGYLMQGDNLVVDAPTSAGKTRIIERLIDSKLSQGLRLVYTSPVKSLSNDKYREFSEKYGRDKIGINTGDFKENLSAPIVLATLETYRNSLLGVEPRMDRFIVVYDEYHYLQDEGRGSAWEESIVLTPKDSQLVLLSASVPNAEDFADWIHELKGKTCRVIHVSTRPVPLVDLVFVKTGFILADKLNLQSRDLFELRELHKNKLTSERRFMRLNPKERYLSLIAPVQEILKKDLSPLVVYAGRRGDVENLAFLLARGVSVPPTPEYLKKLLKRIETLSGWEYVPEELQRLIKKYGIAYHHSGLIPPSRVAIETLLKEGLLRICSGTMGISLGVNFAVRSALVADESRPSEGGETRYTGTEIMQMLGRAGRRGSDAQGFSIWSDACKYAVQKPVGREPCVSSLKFDPSTVLGILGQHENLASLSQFYRKSFFMRGHSQDDILVLDHDLLSAILYLDKEHGDKVCSNIPENFALKANKKTRNESKCNKCYLGKKCFDLCTKATNSPLQKVVTHLQSIGALQGAKPTRFGQMARHFPQAGGLVVARWITTGMLRADTLQDFVQGIACFCGAHHKDIGTEYTNFDFLKGLRINELVAEFYPYELFAELYDENHQGEMVFREFNFGAASVVEMWINPNTNWEQLVAAHDAKNVSPGDIMMILFRFATLLQSCSRISEFEPELADTAQILRNSLLREPLDARTRMLLEAAE